MSRRHPAWDAVGVGTVVVPTVVLAPLMTQAPWADDQLNVYAFGGVYLDRPWEVPVDAFRAVPYFLNLGNFRPLGRTYEWAQNVAVFALSDVFGIPVNVGLRLAALVTAIVLTGCAVLFAAYATGRTRPLRTAPPVPVALLPFAVGGGLVAAGPVSTTVLFSGLYFMTSSLVLAVAAWACATVGLPRLSLLRGTLAVLAGAAIAAFNEMACLAIPLCVVAVGLRARLVFAVRLRNMLRDSGVRFVLLLCAGFLPVIVPVRMAIAETCSRGDCYEGSAVSLPGAAAAVPDRLISWLPPLMWQWATAGTRGWLAAPVTALAAAALLVVAGLLLRALPALPSLDARQTLTLAGVSATVLALAAGIASLNVWMQQAAAAGQYGVGWRDSALTTVGGSALVVAAATALPRARRLTAAVTLIALSGVTVVSAAANSAYHQRSATERVPYLHNRIAQEIADVDPTADGDHRRCALRTRLLSVKNPLDTQRIDQTLDAATAQAAGRRFCTRAPNWPGPLPLYRDATA
ncbi:hypothetical protein [Paractinoplanes durhamensis]|uniref:Transmembrane protein n=1 Tax=Paractinoplanes durhamensis TaxID=113563 RepID=A0ABQ3ZCZ1_9ACTN|nr:hypothetical protein [Actinoplanes durhamensis]GIE07691.1 hypothetical protein Adu01nite_90410 [Actinoplanes durhamensis]